MRILSTPKHIGGMADHIIEVDAWYFMLVKKVDKLFEQSLAEERPDLAEPLANIAFALANIAEDVKRIIAAQRAHGRGRI